MPVEDRLGPGVEPSRGAAPLSGARSGCAACSGPPGVGRRAALRGPNLLSAMRREPLLQGNLEFLLRLFLVVEPGKDHAQQLAADPALDGAKIRLLLGRKQREGV